VSALLRPHKRARHAKPSKLAPALLACGLAAAFAVADGAVLSTAASAGGSVDQFERLARCESGGNWSINTGNGFYGGIQFDLATWRGLGFDGYPHQAGKLTQIAAGQMLHGQRGWGPWPACSRALGLSGNGGVTSSGAVAPAPQVAPHRPAAARASRGATRPALMQRVDGAPAFDGRVMTVADVRTYRASVATWQRRMAARGWRISTDGHFGPQSSGVARRFAAEKGLSATPGTVNAAVWGAAWTARVS